MTFRFARFSVGCVLAIALAACSGSPAASVAGTASAVATPAAATVAPTVAQASPVPGASVPLDPFFATHSDPGLEALLPKQVAGIALTTYSLTLEELLAGGSSDPAEVNAFLQSLGKSMADASFGGAFDPTSTLKGGIQAFKISGADPARLLAGIVGLTQSDIGAAAAVSQGTVGGKNVTIVSVGNGPNDTQWLYGRGDVVFTVLTEDEATAAQYLQALP